MDCIFCKIASGEIPANEVYRDEQAVVFRDLDPKAPVHMLVIPVRHIESVAEATDENAAEMGHLLAVAARVAKQEIPSNNYRVVTNVGPESGQSVQHLHFHILGGRRMGWPPG